LFKYIDVAYYLAAYFKNDRDAEIDTTYGSLLTCRSVNIGAIMSINRNIFYLDKNNIRRFLIF